MQMSAEIDKLAAAMSYAQPKIEGAVKDKVNPHFRTKYADLGAVVDAIKPALAQHGLSFVQVCHDAESAAKVETIILHSSGQWMSAGAVSVPVSKQDAQGFGSALTYARRYSLSAAFGVAPEDDDGNAAANAKPSPGVGVHKPTDGAGDSLTAAQREKIDRTFGTVVDCFEAGVPEEAYKAIETAAFDADEKTFLWSLLDSKQRSAIKKIGDAKRANVLNS